MKYSESDIQTVRDVALMADHVPDTKTYGRTVYAKCPGCGAHGKRKGLKITDRTSPPIHIAKCFECGFSFGSAIDAEKHYAECDFLTAVEHCADMAGINLETNADRRERIAKESAKNLSDSFVGRQLAASGLTMEDVMVRTFDKKGNEEWLPAFRRGSIDVRGNVNENDDEMLIYYYDLAGNPMCYTQRTGSAATRPYIRVRWSNPALHTTAEGKQIKYQTPKGTKACFYIPQKLREAYQAKEEIETLIIQEGEKKAEKACKHGIMSLGIQGIYNIGNATQGLMKELQYIVRECKVRNIILLFDSDWNQLHSGLSDGDAADSRPGQFAGAARKFRKYVETLHNEGLQVDVWFGHLNSETEKGIDDLLAGSLVCHESELWEDMQRTMKTHDGHGQHADLFRISTLSDFQISDFWKLNKFDDFFELHRDRLAELSIFKFGGVFYTKDKDGKFKPKTDTGGSAEFWSVEYDENGKKKIQFYPEKIRDFLIGNHYSRVHTPDLPDGIYSYMVIEDNIIRPVSAVDIRYFVYNHLTKISKDPDVRNKFLNSIGKYISIDLLNTIPDYLYDDFHSSADSQTFVYRNGFVEITSQGVNMIPPQWLVWHKDTIKRDFKRVPIFKEVSMRDGKITITPTEDGERCEFLRFLELTSDFWHKTTDVAEKAGKRGEFMRHMLNKITCIGYLLHSYKDENEQKAVIAMDGVMSEVGTSSGRSGKSLIGKAISKIVNQTLIDGKNANMSEDSFLFNNVQLSTRNIMIDDVRVNFDFSRIYSIITSSLPVNRKGSVKFDIEAFRAPKILITTNHAVSNDDDSTNARRVLISFSDYFNAGYIPANEFGHAFFQDWDEDQWVLFDNLMCECVMVYLRSKEQQWSGSATGMIEPPMVDLRKRQLRQKMGESFLLWADEMFAPGNALNIRKERRDLYDDFYQNCPDIRKYVAAPEFRRRLEAFVEFKGWHLNPSKPHKKTGEMFESWKATHPYSSFLGGPDKSNSKEFFCVSEKGDIQILPDNPFDK